MKSVLISIKPKWCELIASGKKTIEVRKTRPKCATPFKCYIYCTKDKGISFWTGKRYAYADDRSHNLFDVCGNGKAIGEFICNKIDRLAVCGYDNRNTELRRVDDNLAFCNLNYDYMNKCQLSFDNLKKYSNGGGLYGWHISNFVIYDKPKELSEFGKPVICHRGIQKDNCNGCWDCEIKRPPQSWCYVEEAEE